METSLIFARNSAQMYVGLLRLCIKLDFHIISLSIYLLFLMYSSSHTAESFIMVKQHYLFAKSEGVKTIYLHHPRTCICLHLVFPVLFVPYDYSVPQRTRIPESLQ